MPTSSEFFWLRLYDVFWTYSFVLLPLALWTPPAVVLFFFSPKRLKDFTQIFVLTFLFLEASIRIAVSDRVAIASFRNPALYLSGASDPGYGVLWHKWRGALPVTKNITNALLGWSQDAMTPENPLGLSPENRKALTSKKSKILFVGDSFVQGVTPPNETISALINAKNPSLNVINLGVGAYAIDQAGLLLEQTVSAPNVSAILVGFLSLDLDRALGPVFQAQKPYFSLYEGNLVLRGLPINMNQTEYFETASPGIVSYACNLILRSFERINEWDYFRGRRLREKMDLNERLIQAIAGLCHAKKIPFYFVFFCSRTELDVATWRETFLRTLFAKYQLPFIDGKLALFKYAQKKGISPATLYGPDGHPTTQGNQALATEITEILNIR